MASGGVIMWWILGGLAALYVARMPKMPMAMNGEPAAATTERRNGNGVWRAPNVTTPAVSPSGSGTTDAMSAFWLKVFGRDWRTTVPPDIGYGVTASAPIVGGAPAAPSGEYAYVTGAPAVPGDWRNPLSATGPTMGLEDPGLLYEPMPWFESPEGEFVFIPDIMI